MLTTLSSYAIYLKKDEVQAAKDVIIAESVALRFFIDKIEDQTSELLSYQDSTMHTGSGEGA